MKAIQAHEFGLPEVMKLTEVEDPRPGKGQILVRLHAAGVNPVDTYIRSGQYPLIPTMPYTPGMDGAGVVEALGDETSGFSVGDRVYIGGTLTGSYAEKAICLESQVHPLPGHLSFEQGAAIGVPYSTAYHALCHRARAVAGEVLLVHGASGGVGNAALQLARASGMKIIATAGTDEGRKLALEQGAHYVVDHHDPDHAAEVLKITGKRRVDIILEMLANVNLGNDLPLLAEHGRVVVIGSRGKVEIDPRELMGRNASILGMVILRATEQEKSVIFAALGAGLENGTLKPIVGKRFPLAEAAVAHHEVMESKAYGKIVLLP